MNAVILAGGFGSRLKPLTDTVPKPMLPVANAPMLDYAVSHLHAVGIKDVVLTLGYYPEQITEWMDGYTDIRARYVTEDVPLGTAGGVRKACRLLDGRFIVLSGDALENIDFAAMLSCHEKSGKLVTMAVTSVDDARAFGLIERDGRGTVTKLTEKPQDAVGGIVNCGVYIFERSALSLIPVGEKYDFARDLFPRLLSEGMLNSYYHDGFWSDIGSPQSYYNANFKMLDGAFYRRIYNRHRVTSHKIGSASVSLSAHSALVTGKCAESVIGHCAAITSGADVHSCVVLPYVTVRGHHDGEIIGDGYSLPIALAPEFNQHDSTQIYKNFS